MGQMFSWRKGAVAVSASLVAVTAWAGTQASQAPNGVPTALMKKLTRGVNITRWFGYVKPDDTALFENYLVEDDLQNFKRLHVTYVRLCVNPDLIYRNGTPDPTNLSFIDKGIEKLEKAGIAVIWDLHDNGQMKLDTPDHDQSGFIRFWEALARHYKGKQESSTVFELLNEPQFLKNPDAWYKLQTKAVAAIRAIDSARTILVASTFWNSIDTMSQMTPLEEKNLIYSFHCYDPFRFTHQGASWTGDEQKAMRDIPFPSSPEAVSAMIDKIPEQFRAGVLDYGKQRYDSKYLLNRLELAKTWGVRNHVPVLLGEFGAFPPVSPKDSRGRWFEGMRQAIDQLGLPNAIWGYDDALGLGREKTSDGKVHLDEVTLKHFYQVGN